MYGARGRKFDSPRVHGLDEIISGRQGQYCDLSFLWRAGGWGAVWPLPIFRNGQIIVVLVVPALGNEQNNVILPIAVLAVTEKSSGRSLEFPRVRFQ
jgi:hypothetical protein